MNKIERVILLFGTLVLVSVLFMMIKFQTECTVEKTTSTAIVTDKKKEKILLMVKPSVVYKTKYTVFITLEDGTEGAIKDNKDMYDKCDINDTVNIAITKKYHDDDLIHTYYEWIRPR